MRAKVSGTAQQNKQNSYKGSHEMVAKAAENVVLNSQEYLFFGCPNFSTETYVAVCFRSDRPCCQPHCSYMRRFSTQRKILTLHVMHVVVTLGISLVSGVSFFGNRNKYTELYGTLQGTLHWSTSAHHSASRFWLRTNARASTVNPTQPSSFLRTVTKFFFSENLRKFRLVKKPMR